MATHQTRSPDPTNSANRRSLVEYLHPPRELLDQSEVLRGYRPPTRSRQTFLVKPDKMADDVGGEAMAIIRILTRLTSLPQLHSLS